MHTSELDRIEARQERGQRIARTAGLHPAQVNEVLCKVLAHNLCVLIASVYELGLEPVFWTSEADRPPAPILALDRGF